MAEVIRGARLESERLVLAFAGHARAPLTQAQTRAVPAQAEKTDAQPEQPVGQLPQAAHSPERRDAERIEVQQRETAQREAQQRKAEQRDAVQRKAVQREAEERKAREREAAQREAAQREAERQAVLEKAHADGYAAGFARGEAAHAQAIAALGSLLASTGRALQDGLIDAEDLMVEIAFEAICKILGESMAHATGVVGVVRAAIAALPQRESLVLRVSPDDFATLDANRSQLQPSDAGGPVQLIADPRVQQGGCLVELAGGTIDARLETQLQRLAEVLVSTRRRPADAPV